MLKQCRIIAAVNENGLLTVLGEGKAVITAKDENGETYNITLITNVGSMSIRMEMSMQMTHISGILRQSLC